jgi:hypothetical protein
LQEAAGCYRNPFFHLPSLNAMRLPLAAFLLVFAATLSAQNLIPNPGFEDLKKCPKGLGQIDRARGWSSPNKGTPDYFNSCYTKDFETAGVPNNFFGTRNAQEGHGYAGILWGKQEKEYLQVALVVPILQMPPLPTRLGMRSTSRSHPDA